MRVIYIECNMGVAGDMLMSALIELHPNSDDFIKRLNHLNIPNVKFEKQKSVKCGIHGTHINVYLNEMLESDKIHEHNHHHRSVADIKNIVNNINLPEKVKNDVLSVYNIIADAESKVHGVNIENIHFHEVGTMDALADITGCCMLINELSVDKIMASPINTGKGTVKCAHGILPVPAPATANILCGIPIYNNEIEGELCTPTGAALLKYFVDEFVSMPLMKVSKIGYGMGTKDFDTANCVRVIIGETKEEKQEVIELYCNIDDMNGEMIGFALSKIKAAGALDVFTSSVSMKKNRPGVLLTCICEKEKRQEVLKSIFKYTSTIGVRENICNRYVLDRVEKSVKTNYGNIKIKESFGYGVVKKKAEYEDLARLAEKNNISISEIKILD